MEDVQGRGRARVRFPVGSVLSQGRLDVRLDSGQGSREASMGA